VIPRTSVRWEDKGGYGRERGRSETDEGRGMGGEE